MPKADKALITPRRVLLRAPATMPALVTGSGDDAEHPSLLTSDDLPDLGEVRAAAIRCVDRMSVNAELSADAHLIRACAEFEAGERQVLVLYDGGARIEDDDAPDRAIGTD